MSRRVSINYQLGSLYSVITAFLYATQEPFSFPAAKHSSTRSNSWATQVSLLVSLPLLAESGKKPPGFRRPGAKASQPRLTWA